MSHRNNERGFALIAVMVLAGFLIAVLAVYFYLSGVTRSSTRSSMDSTRGYYAAEGAVNRRLDALRTTFDGYNLPTGTSPPDAPGQLPCQDADQGTGDFVCESLMFTGREVLSHVREDAANPVAIVIPRGELYQNLRAQEYNYDLNAVSVSFESRPEAILNMRVRSRLVPLFQFAAFYNKDLEILPGPAMYFAGPVHTNGDLYLDAATSLTVEGQVTTVGDLYQGRKNQDLCVGAGVQVFDPAAPTSLPACGAGRTQVTEPELVPWNGQVRTGVEVVDVPTPEALDPVAGSTYWDAADMRVALMLDGSGNPIGIEVQNSDESPDSTAMTALSGCAGTVWTNDDLENNREGFDIRMLNVDVQKTLDCIQGDNAIMGGRALNDLTSGGLVWHLTVKGPDSATFNNYGVRVVGGRELVSTDPLAPAIKGMTVVTDQALYVQGDFNKDNKKPAAFLADSLNVLSNSWVDGHYSGIPNASGTTINAAFLAGTDSTGIDPVGGNDGSQDDDQYNGGLENYPRFHEDWTDETLTYRGSFVSLNRPRHVDGLWDDQEYSPPIRDWGYDTDFNDASKLPPLSPRFVYIVQDLFLRDFEL